MTKICITFAAPIRIWKAKGYTEFDALNRTYEEHQKFLKNYSRDVNIHLEDKDFKERLYIVFEKSKSWIDNF